MRAARASPEGAGDLGSGPSVASVPPDARCARLPPRGQATSGAALRSPRFPPMRAARASPRGGRRPRERPFGRLGSPRCALRAPPPRGQATSGAALRSPWARLPPVPAQRPAREGPPANGVGSARRGRQQVNFRKTAVYLPRFADVNQVLGTGRPPYWVESAPAARIPVPCPSTRSA